MPIKIIFFISLFLTLFLPLFFPHLNLLYFAPFMVMVYYKYSLFTALWIAFGLGVFTDLLSSMPFGISSSIFCLTTAFLYPQKIHFFEDKASTPFIMTLLFSTASSLLKFLFCKFFEKKFAFSMASLCTDLVCMPFLDASYAYLCVMSSNFILKKSLS
jgi:rod shape-determining protein MreD